jgi:hypothetical protein
VESDPAEKVQAPYVYKDLVQHDPILGAQTIETRHKARVAMALLCQSMPSQTLVGCCLEGAQGKTKHVLTMEVNRTDYHQPDGLISGHPSVTAFLCGQGRTMNYRVAFNTVKQASLSARSISTVFIFRQSIVLGSTTVLLRPGGVRRRACMFV